MQEHLQNGIAQEDFERSVGFVEIPCHHFDTTSAAPSSVGQPYPCE